MGNFVTDNAPNMGKIQAEFNEKFDLSHGCSINKETDA